MASTVLKRQFITDAAGNPIGVILPLEEFALVEETLKHRLPYPGTADKLAQMEQAANDALFMSDLREAMSAFAGVDGQWWDQPNEVPMAYLPRLAGSGLLANLSRAAFTPTKSCCRPV